MIDIKVQIKSDFKVYLYCILAIVNEEEVSVAISPNVQANNKRDVKVL